MLRVLPFDGSATITMRGETLIRCAVAGNMETCDVEVTYRAEYGGVLETASFATYLASLTERDLLVEALAVEVFEDVKEALACNEVQVVVRRGPSSDPIALEVRVP
jgi:NADPH-dependent 7-cyano-7-deazaguanine reductase QueF